MRKQLNTSEIKDANIVRIECECECGNVLFRLKGQVEFLPYLDRVSLDCSNCGGRIVIDKESLLPRYEAGEKS